MPSYKLCYFNARGLAETNRLLFAEAGVDYEDARITDWPEQKPKMLFGKMPVLFVDGEQIAHSRAAARYLAREFKLDGGSSLNAAKMDMFIETFFEAVSKVPSQEKDEAEKAKLFKSVLEDHIIPVLVKYQESIIANKGDYLLGNDPTAADFAFYSILSNIIQNMTKEDILKPVPKVKDMMTAIETRPKIAKWIKERPDTQF